MNKTAHFTDIPPARLKQFESYFEKGDGCWVWQGPTKSKEKPYGRFYFGGHYFMPAHRVSFEFFNGQIPPGRHVLHTCDNPPCVNPSHLFLGTQTDNNQDRDKKGRNVSHSGEQHSAARLTNEIVLDIRKRWAAGERPVSIARSYNLSLQHLNSIYYRRCWKDI